VAAYSFRDCLITFSGPAGTIRLGAGQGPAIGVADEGITIERAEDRNTLLVGINGETLNLVHAGNTGTVRLRLLKTSLANGQLIDVYNDQKTRGSNWGTDMQHITVEDLARKDKIVAGSLAFAGEPAVTFGKVGGVNEWTFHAGRIQMFLAKSESTQRIVGG